MQVLGGIWQADFGQLILIGIIVSMVMGAGRWWFVVRGEGVADRPDEGSVHAWQS